MEITALQLELDMLRTRATWLEYENKLLRNRIDIAYSQLERAIFGISPEQTERK